MTMLDTVPVILGEHLLGGGQTPLDGPGTGSLL
jgi:hypothetical protein